MKHRTLFLIIVLAAGLINAQDTLLLQQCYQNAILNSPLFKQKEYYTKLNTLQHNNLRTGYFPQLKLVAQSTWQSDVTAIDVELPFPGIQFPSPSKDQYKIALEANQIIFDGGYIKHNQIIENKNRDIEIQQTEVELTKLKEQINLLFFSLLLIEKKQQILSIYLDEISARKQSIYSGVKNGIVMPINLDILLSEELKLRQQLFELKENRRLALNTLEEYTGVPYNENTIFILPDIQINNESHLQRPELKLFELQIEKMEAVKNLTNTQRLPKAFAFTQAGYGKPGLNMLSDNFDTYCIVGLAVNWNVFDWNKTQREKQILEIKKSIVQTQKENFNLNVSIALQNQYAQINKLENLLKTDEEMIGLRENITAVAASQLENGIITSTAYLTELNAEKILRMDYETHKLQLIQAKVNCLILQGVW